jgi:hypothetical protein
MSDHSLSLSTPPIFILCDNCYWCATYIDKNRTPVGNICPNCNTNTNELTSFPIMLNESFSVDYNDERETELEFMLEHEKNGSYPDQNQTATNYDAAATSITTSPSPSAGRYQGNYNGPNYTSGL